VYAEDRNADIEIGETGDSDAEEEMEILDEDDIEELKDFEYI
jgi:hypothetical protein